ncbi:hypothetical protein NBRC116588_17870 [Pyruvatibacter sp. HU-CL02332]
MHEMHLSEIRLGRVCCDTGAMPDLRALVAVAGNAQPGHKLYLVCGLFAEGMVQTDMDAKDAGWCGHGHDGDLIAHGVTRRKSDQPCAAPKDLTLVLRMACF